MQPLSFASSVVSSSSRGSGPDRRVARVRRGPLAVAAVVAATVLSLHTAAQAQQLGGPFAMQGYQGYPPPPSGPPPGSRGYGYYQPRYYAPARQFGLYRPFTLGVGVGVGALSFNDAYGRINEGALSYTLRVGFGVTRNWLVFLGAEGAGTDHQSFGVWQTAYLIGAQCFVVDRLYLRGGVGVAHATAENALGIGAHGTGEAFMGAAGLQVR